MSVYHEKIPLKSLYNVRKHFRHFYLNLLYFVNKWPLAKDIEERIYHQWFIYSAPAPIHITHHYINEHGWMKKWYWILGIRLTAFKCSPRWRISLSITESICSIRLFASNGNESIIVQTELGFIRLFAFRFRKTSYVWRGIILQSICELCMCYYRSCWFLTSFFIAFTNSPISFPTLMMLLILNTMKVHFFAFFTLVIQTFYRISSSELLKKCSHTITSINGIGFFFSFEWQTRDRTRRWI